MISHYYVQNHQSCDLLSEVEYPILINILYQPFPTYDRLYTSPVRPPTKEQKKITPLQWLEQDIIGQEGKSSVNETRQLLTFTLSEDKKFNPNKTPIKGCYY